jgi:formate dehydrogenase subunit gamma
MIRMLLRFALLMLLFTGTPAFAQQPNAVNPNANAVKEDQLLQSLPRIQGRGTIPDVKSYVIEHPAGRSWREFHERTLPIVAAIAILGMLGLLVVFYLWRGMVRLEHGRSGYAIVRFNAFERFIHWLTATSFIMLGITGLNITFGKRLLLPLLGPQTFTTWSEWAKYAHNYISFAFTLGVIVIFLMWIPGNIPNRVDLQWLKRGGGIIGHDHPPAYRFNAGQKAIYWIQVLGGLAIAATGYVLMFPFYLTDISGMETAQVVHGIVAVLFVAVMLAHIYIGTIGMQGAFEAMGSGTVDLNWAKEHHALWLEQEQARTGPGQAQAQPMTAPAE